MPYEHESNWLKERGFIPGRAIVSNEPGFDLDDLFISLRKGTASHPKTVSVPIAVNTFEPVAIDTVRKVVFESEHAQAEPGEFANHWYVEGAIQPSKARVRMYVIADTSSCIDILWLQLITDEHAANGDVMVEGID